MFEKVIIGSAVVGVGTLLLYISHGVWLLSKYGTPEWRYVPLSGVSSKDFTIDDDPNPLRRHYVSGMLIILLSFILAMLLVVCFWAVGEAVTSGLSILS